MNSAAASHSHSHSQPLPAGVLIGAGALVLFSLATVTAARLLHLRRTAAPAAAAVTELHLTFTDRSADHAVEVRDVDHGNRLIHVVAPESNGFMRGVLRGMARTRRNEHIDAAPAFTLTRWADGRMSLADPQTGREVPLEVFGPSNSRPFMQLFDDAAAPAPAAEVHAR
ncbi:MAG TPA: photosynthetic complex assembly protein PuhC [Steroidobacteraceae bacterium]|nr:photosynthetic complex assembly protein PuhC [Steroidobacteraceae bacterium]